jgi:hypothetical protein
MFVHVQLSWSHSDSVGLLTEVSEIVIWYVQYTVYTFSVVQYSILITSIQYYNTLAMYSTWVYR